MTSAPTDRTTPAPAGADRVSGRLLAASALSTVLGALPVFLLGGLAVLVREDLAFSEVQLGLAVSAFFTVSALSSVPAGRVAQALGAWATTVLAAGVSASALLLAAGPVSSYGGLLGALGLAGVGNALAQIGNNDALARGVPRRRQGFAFGVKQSAVPGATLLAGLALPFVAIPLGWRPTFALAAGLALVYAVLAPGPRARPTGVRRRGGDRADAALSALVAVAVAAALGSGAANALGAFLVESAVADGVAPRLAGLLLAGGSLLGVVVRLSVGWRADSRDGGHLVVVAGMLASGAVGLLLIAAGGPVLPLGTALAFGLGWSWPGLLNFAVVRLNPSAPAVATSITQTGVFAGGALGPLLFGLAVATTSYAVAWAGAAASMLAAAGLLLAARRLLLADRARREAAAPAATGTAPGTGAAPSPAATAHPSPTAPTASSAPDAPATLPARQ